MNIKAVIFDLDDTLISEKQYVMSGFRIVAQAISENFGVEFSVINDSLQQLFEEDSKFVFNRLLEKFDLSYRQKEIDWLIELYRNHDPEIHFFDDVMPCLEQLKQLDMKTGIITDGYKETQRKKLAALNANSWFDHIIVTDEFGREYWKPNPLSFEQMAEVLNVNYDQMMYVGDNPEKDFYIGTIYPIKTVRILRSCAVHSKKVYFRNVKEIEAIQSLNELANLLKLSY